MKDPRTIVLKPLLTEKNTMLQTYHNKVAFKVAADANKIEIAKAVAELFDVKVLKVHTIRMKGKPKRLGRYEGRRSHWKKAIVTLHPDSNIDFFEGA